MDIKYSDNMYEISMDEGRDTLLIDTDNVMKCK